MRPKAKKEADNLNQNIKKLLEKYSKLKTQQLLTGEEDISGAQAALYSIVRQGKELTG